MWSWHIGKHSHNATRQRFTHSQILRRYALLSTCSAVYPTYIFQWFLCIRHCDARMEMYSSWLQTLVERRNVKILVERRSTNILTWGHFLTRQVMLRELIYICLGVSGKVPDEKRWGWSKSRDFPRRKRASQAKERAAVKSQNTEVLGCGGERGRREGSRELNVKVKVKQDRSVASSEAAKSQL